MISNISRRSAWGEDSLFLLTFPLLPPFSIHAVARLPPPPCSGSWLCNTSRQGGHRRRRLAGGRGAAERTEKRGEGLADALKHERRTRSQWDPVWNKPAETERQYSVRTWVGTLIHSRETVRQGRTLGRHSLLWMCLWVCLCPDASQLNITVGTSLGGGERVVKARTKRCTLGRDVMFSPCNFSPTLTQSGLISRGLDKCCNHSIIRSLTFREWGTWRFSCGRGDTYV